MQKKVAADSQADSHASPRGKTGPAAAFAIPRVRGFLLSRPLRFGAFARSRRLFLHGAFAFSRFYALAITAPSRKLLLFHMKVDFSFFLCYTIFEPCAGSSRERNAFPGEKTLSGQGQTVSDEEKRPPDGFRTKVKEKPCIAY